MFVVIGAPVQHCMLRIDSLDSKGDSVLDLIHPFTSPLVDCRRELREIVSSGCEACAPLAPVFAHFEDCPEVNFMEMLMEAKAMGKSFQVQITTRRCSWTLIRIHCFSKCIRNCQGKKRLTMWTAHFLYTDVVCGQNRGKRSSIIFDLRMHCGQILIS